MDLKIFDDYMKEQDIEENDKQFLRYFWKIAKSLDGFKQATKSMFKWYKIESKYTKEPCKAEERIFAESTIYHNPQYMYVESDDEVQTYIFDKNYIKVLKDYECIFCKEIEVVGFVEGDCRISFDLENPIARLSGKHIILRVDDSFVFKALK